MLYVTLLGYALGLLPSIVSGIQVGVGDKASGASKAQMAHDVLAVAVQGAGSVLAPGSANATLANAAGAAAGEVIDAASAISAVLSHIKTTGAVHAAYVATVAAQQPPVVAAS